MSIDHFLSTHRANFQIPEYSQSEFSNSWVLIERIFKFLSTWAFRATQSEFSNSWVLIERIFKFLSTWAFRATQSEFSNRDFWPSWEQDTQKSRRAFPVVIRYSARRVAWICQHVAMRWAAGWDVPLQVRWQDFILAFRYIQNHNTLPVLCLYAYSLALRLLSYRPISNKAKTLPLPIYRANTSVTCARG